MKTVLKIQNVEYNSRELCTEAAEIIAFSGKPMFVHFAEFVVLAGGIYTVKRTIYTGCPAC